MTYIDAVYEHGLFRPIVPIDLPEQTRVRIELAGGNPDIDETAYDAFFTAANRMRLADLMARWRQSRDVGTPFSAAEREELDCLVELELQASIARSEDAVRTATP